jgi:predicted lipoprotein with Yx(FWY)xxD motif
MKKVGIFTLMVIFAAAFGMAQSWSSNSDSQSTSNVTNYTINISYKSGIGHYLVDSNGMTLYYFTENVNGETFNGPYLNFWSPFYVSNVVVPSGLNPKDFSVITGGNGKPQIAYKGWPLYYYINDTKPGETNGQGFKGLWYVMKPDYTVMIATNPKIGNYLVDANGMTLYYLGGESTSTIKCNGMCLKFWPLFDVKNVIVPGGLNPSNFKIFERPDGNSELSYNGLPLYYFIRDSKRGDVTGNNLKDPFGIWHSVILNSSQTNSSQQSTDASVSVVANTSSTQSAQSSKNW